MSEKKKQQADRMLAYARLLETQAGKAVRPYRADGYVNLLNKYGTSKDSSEAYKFVPEATIPDESLTMFYEGNGLFAKIIDAPAEEALKHGFNLKDVSDEKVEDFFREALDELDWEETAMTAIKWARLFGGSLAVMLINDGHDNLAEPLDWEHIRSIDDIRVYDRSVIQPAYETMFHYDPRDPFRTRGSRLGMPEYYSVYSRYGSFRVHESRCLVFQNGILPENSTNSIYQFWGMPEYIRIHRAIQDAEIAHHSAPKMLVRSVQPVYKMKDLAAELSTEEGESKVLRRLQTIDMARGLMNSITIDSEGEDYDFRSFQFTGVSDVIDSACNYLSALTNIPQTILFGRSPAGMNATGESDLENWYSYVERIQKRMLKSNLRYLLSVIFQAGIATGEVDEVPSITVEFNPLWSLSESEQADLDQKKAAIAQTKAQTAQLYVDMQAIDPQEVRRKLADSSEFDVETMLDEYEDEEDLMAAYTQEQTPEEDGYAQGVDVQAHNTDPGTEGSASTAAPAATKLPQDMSEEEKKQSEETPQNPAKRPGRGVQVDGDTPSSQDDQKAGVGVLVVKEGKIMAGTRKTPFGYGLICGPGGHIKVGETPTQAAFRETEEEFGISPKELVPIGRGPAEPDTGIQPYIFLCTEYDGEPNCVDREMAEPEFRSLEELELLKPSMFQPFADGVELLKAIIKRPDPDDPDTTDPHDDGGEGSGNFNHKGIPGQTGGSAPSGDSTITSESFKRGTGDFELTGDVKDMYLTETARARIEGATAKVKTAADLKDYLSERGITLETSYEPLQQAMDKEIPSVKQQADYIIAAIEEYDELGGLSALKAVHIYEADLDAQAQYSYRAAGEGPVEDEGHIYISDLADGFQVMHEFAHAFADSSKPEGMDVVEWSAELNRNAGLSESAGTYFGANSDVREAERFADAVGHALTTGGDEKLAFVSKVSNIVRERKDGTELEARVVPGPTNLFISENPIDKSAFSATIKSTETSEDGGPGSGNHGHEGVPGQVGGSAPKGEVGRSKFKRKGDTMDVTSDLKVKLNTGTCTVKAGTTITNVTDFAGKGFERKVDVEAYLIDQVGGKAGEWTKAKGNGRVVLPNGKERDAELHWFEHPEEGQVRMKVKFLKGGRKK